MSLTWILIKLQRQALKNEASVEVPKPSTVSLVATQTGSKRERKQTCLQPATIFILLTCSNSNWI